MKHRRGGHCAVVRPVAAVLGGHRVAGQHAAAMRQHHALGAAGGAGCVGHREDVVLGERAIAQCACRLCQQGLVRLAQNDEVFNAGWRRRARRLFQRGIDKQHTGAGVFAQKADLRQ